MSMGGSPLRGHGLLLLLLFGAVRGANGLPGTITPSSEGSGAGLPSFFATTFPESVLGKWLPAAPPQSVLGPLAYAFLSVGGGAFTALRDPATGDVWLTILEGQTFRVRKDKMQYCFGYTAPDVTEQSPFTVNSTSGTEVSFCWREGLPGMQTHAAGCNGCECAAIRITLTGEDRVELTFWQSPPVVHAHLVLKRAGRAPNMTQITKTLPQPYTNCNITDVCLPWQFCPGAATAGGAIATAAPRRPAGCLLAARLQARRAEIEAMEARAAEEVVAPPPPVPDPEAAPCFQLNGDNLLINNLLPAGLRYDIPDVKLQVIKPIGACAPCKVQYAVSPKGRVATL